MPKGQNKDFIVAGIINLWRTKINETQQTTKSNR